MFDQLENFVGVTPLVVVPGNEFYEGLVEHDTCFCIKDGGSWVAQEVGGYNHRLRCSPECPSWWSRKLLLQLCTDFFIGGWFCQFYSQVNNRYVQSWYTEGHTGQFAFYLWDNQCAGFCSAGRGWDDVAGSSTSASPVFLGRTVNGLLGCGGSMYGAHQAFNNTKVVVDNLCQWCQTVGGAGCVGNYQSYPWYICLRLRQQQRLESLYPLQERR